MQQTDRVVVAASRRAAATVVPAKNLGLQYSWIMRLQLIALGLLAAVTLASAQTSSTGQGSTQSTPTQQKQTAQKPTQQKPVKNPKPMTITGCVQRDEDSTDRFVLSDSESGMKYRLTGTDIREYLGRRVQAVGGTVASKKLSIVGGLMPNPNVAAQGGAIDPAQAAVASSGGSAPVGNVQLRDFHIQAIRPLTGSCSQ
jgi:hypothetical protein